MNLFRTSFYTSVSTAVTFICGFIVAKVVAVQIGPPGVAMVGQFQNIVAIIIMFGNGAISMGIVKHLSQSKGDVKMQQRIITTGLSIVCICSLVLSLLVITFSSQLSVLTFRSEAYQLVYTAFGVFLFFSSVNAVMGNIFNGLQEIKKLTASNIALSITGIVSTVSFAYLLGVKGVLIALNVTALFAFGVNLLLFKRLANHRFSFSFHKLDIHIVRSLSSFSLMTVFSTVLLPAIQLFVRNKIISSYTITDAGYWQGVTKISDYYLAFVTTVLGIYYLPKLSEIQERQELRSEILRGYMRILPIVGALALLIFLLRRYVVLALFSTDFLPMMPLFAFQLVGDFLKISGYLIAFLLWAKAMVKTFLITEVVFACTSVLFSHLFITWYGLVGATYAFALNYLLYLITMAFLMRGYLLAPNRL